MKQNNTEEKKGSRDRAIEAAVLQIEKAIRQRGCDEARPKRGGHECAGHPDRIYRV